MLFRCKPALHLKGGLRYYATCAVRAREAVGMQIDCLMGTYGRYSVACEALACFLQQTRLSEATLLIYNQHPIPLRFDHPRVRIVNESIATTHSPAMTSLIRVLNSLRPLEARVYASAARSVAQPGSLREKEVLSHW